MSSFNFPAVVLAFILPTMLTNICHAQTSEDEDNDPISLESKAAEEAAQQAGEVPVKSIAPAPDRKVEVKQATKSAKSVDSNPLPSADVPLSSPIETQVVQEPVAQDAREKVLMIPHPNAAKGLVRINDDKSYQYKVKTREKKDAASFGVSSMTPPNISNVIGGQQVTFKSMYGSAGLVGISGNYEWIPTRKYGAFGILFESGLSMGHGQGILASSPPQPAQETYTLFVVPLTVFFKYRFEYSRKQWLVPYIEGGATYYGLVELRSDNKQTNIAGAPAAGGGGGLAINISRSASDSAFRMAEEFGVTDLWLNLEVRAMAGLKPSLDFTNTTANVGIIVDY